MFLNARHGTKSLTYIGKIVHDTRPRVGSVIGSLTYLSTDIATIKPFHSFDQGLEGLGVCVGCNLVHHAW